MCKVNICGIYEIDQSVDYRFDCPICKGVNACTGIHYEIVIGSSFECSNCGIEYTVIEELDDNEFTHSVVVKGKEFWIDELEFNP